MPAARKPAGKTAAKTAGRPFAKGDDPRRGGGKPGRSGRKPLAFLQECSDLVDTAVLEKVRDYLAKPKADPTDPAWRWCAEYVSGYSKAKPAQSVRHTDKHDNDVPPTQLHVHLGDNGRGIAPPLPVTNGNGRHG